MLKNVYSSLSGALAQEKVFDILANNLANINTAGFKEESVAFKLLTPNPEKNYQSPLPEANYRANLEDNMPFRGNEMKYVGISGINRNDQQGSSIETKNPLDVMLESEGYFGVNTHSGIRYTRNGSLSLNPEGVLVDYSGNPVMGEKGSIILTNHKVEINKLGEVYQNNELVDRLLVYEFQDSSQLEKIGNNLYFFKGLEGERSVVDVPNMRQGALESSNVNAIKNLTNLILAHRSYEAYQKTIKSYDSIMEKSNSTLATVKG